MRCNLYRRSRARSCATSLDGATIYRSHEKLSGPTATSALSGKVDVCAGCNGGVTVNRAIPRPSSRDRWIVPEACARSLAYIFAFDSTFGFMRLVTRRDIGNHIVRNWARMRNDFLLLGDRVYLEHSSYKYSLLVMIQMDLVLRQYRTFVTAHYAEREVERVTRSRFLQG